MLVYDHYWTCAMHVKAHVLNREHLSQLFQNCHRLEKKNEICHNESINHNLLFFSFIHSLVHLHIVLNGSKVSHIKRETRDISSVTAKMVV